MQRVLHKVNRRIGPSFETPSTGTPEVHEIYHGVYGFMEILETQLPKLNLTGTCT